MLEDLNESKVLDRMEEELVLALLAVIEAIMAVEPPETALVNSGLEVLASKTVEALKVAKRSELVLRGEDVDDSPGNPDLPLKDKLTQAESLQPNGKVVAKLDDADNVEDGSVVMVLDPIE